MNAQRIFFATQVGRRQSKSRGSLLRAFVEAVPLGRPSEAFEPAINRSAESQQALAGRYSQRRKLRNELLWRRIHHSLHSQLPSRIHIRRHIINKNRLLRFHFAASQRFPVNQRVRLAGAYAVGINTHRKILEERIPRLFVSDMNGIGVSTAPPSCASSPARLETPRTVSAADPAPGSTPRKTHRTKASRRAAW